MNGKWQIWIDTGGTFTDCIAVDPRGRTSRTKVLSSSRLRGRLLERVGAGVFRFAQNWRLRSGDIFAGYEFNLLAGSFPPLPIRQIDWKAQIMELGGDLSVDLPADFEITAREEAPVLAARLITGTPLGRPLPDLEMRLGSTRGTNALLERKGAAVALLVTAGFADLVRIGTQQRPDLFQLNIPDPPLLYERVFEVRERLDASGEVVVPLEDAEAERLAGLLKAGSFDAVAIALMHAYRNPAHEEKLREALAAAGMRFISCSQELSPSIKILPRAQTALVNAYLSPVLHDYLSQIQAKVAGARLRVMTSAAGLVAAGRFKPKDSLLSGPAAGVVGAGRIAEKLGYPKVLTLDMGGTSTDTARYEGAYDYRFVTAIDRIEMLSPALSIETVAAGGGSICRFDGTRLCVGPESAGADPGPACYGAGGPLTLTDVNLLLGKLDPSAMGIPVRSDLAAAALQRLRVSIEAALGVPYSDRELLEGFEKIAVEKMAEAIRRISVARGFDPKEYALLAFGGAGGLHACRIADQLDIDTILLPYDAGLLSAYGIGQARVERLLERQVLRPLPACRQDIAGIVAELEGEARGQLAAEGFDAASIERREVLLYLRFKGQDSTIEIPLSSGTGIEEVFEAKYRRLFGHYPQSQIVEVESIKVIVANRLPEKGAGTEKGLPHQPEPEKYILAGPGGRQVPVFLWDKLQSGATVSGPAILLNPFSTAFVDKGWRLYAADGRDIVARRQEEQRSGTAEHKEAIELELFTNRFSAIAEEMGAQLQRTAFSVNIKERLDFSCAILDPDAELLVNAPHIPVHLGSLGICARLLRERLPLGPGDIVITNHPKYGGSHLPDVTLLSAVFTDDDRDLIGYVINRAHHAEIGGRRPGSMPPDATALLEEGVAILPAYLARGSEVRWADIRRLLSGAAYPTRAVEENLSDINAAMASLRNGERALKAMARTHGLEKVRHYMAALKATAQQALADALVPYENRRFRAVERLDDGREIAVDISVSGNRIDMDFKGTSSPHPHNLNANISIVYSAVIYVLRLLCGRSIPLNEGLMQHVRIRLPESSFLHPPFEDDPAFCPAVVGGNTEVSQRLVDTLLKAFGLAACSQGTMNNFLFGNRRFGYYETIGGGAGAGHGFHGRSGVHQHMTNTRITDPEELEFRYPVRLHRFSLRPGSGGKGQWCGGNGIIREVEFLEPVEVTILSQHRRESPYGMHGGEPGQAGRQFLIRRDGSRERLEGIDSAEVSAGDRILIETPGGGGWNKAE